MGDEKTALVLSAGGMFGAYQAGVWKALDGVLQPDIVVGASVGALNGWLIAAGYSGAKLVERWLHPSAGSALSPHPRTAWRFDPVALRLLARQLFEEARPRLPFGLVVVQLPGLRTVLVRHPAVTAEHLAATCSIPVFLPSVEIDGARFCDGGFLEKLPLWAAAEMGATRIVAVDSLPSLDLWWLRAGARAVSWFAPLKNKTALPEITLIRPSEPLGTAREAVDWRLKNIERWIALGESDAAAAVRERASCIQG